MKKECSELVTFAGRMEGEISGPCGKLVGRIVASRWKHSEIEKLKRQLASIKSKRSRINNAFCSRALWMLRSSEELKNPLIPQKVEDRAENYCFGDAKTDRLEPLAELDFRGKSSGTNGYAMKIG